MGQKTADNHAKLLELLPELLTKVTTAQTQLKSIDSDLAVSLAAVNKSITATSSSSSSITTLAAFEESLEWFCTSVEEVANVLLSTCKSIEQIEIATQQIIVGINTQLNPSMPQPANQSSGPNTTRSSIPRISTRSSSTPPSKFPDLVRAIDSLDATLLRRS
jgi:hypothetical protein